MYSTVQDSAKVTQRLSKKLEKMVQDLEKQIEDVDKTIAATNKKSQLDMDGDGYLTTDELTRAIQQLKVKYPPEQVQKIIDKLDLDKGLHYEKGVVDPFA